MQAPGILEVAVAEGARLAEHGHDLVLCGSQVHEKSVVNGLRGPPAHAGWCAPGFSSPAPATNCLYTACPSSSTSRNQRGRVRRRPTGTSGRDASATAAAASACIARPRSAPPDAAPPATYRPAVRSTIGATRRWKTCAGTFRAASGADRLEF